MLRIWNSSWVGLCMYLVFGAGGRMLDMLPRLSECGSLCRLMLSDVTLSLR